MIGNHFGHVISDTIGQNYNTTLTLLQFFSSLKCYSQSSTTATTYRNKYKLISGLRNFPNQFCTQICHCKNICSIITQNLKANHLTYSGHMFHKIKCKINLYHNYCARHFLKFSSFFINATLGIFQCL